MAPERLLGEDETAVHRHLENPAGRLHEVHLGARESLCQLSRQTGGSRPIVSDDAEFDRDLHRVFLLKSMDAVVRRIVAIAKGDAKGSAAL
jgi:hypothetical protein